MNFQINGGKVNFCMNQDYENILQNSFYKKQRGEALISYDGFVENVYQCHKSLSSRLILSTFIGFIAYC